MLKVPFQGEELTFGVPAALKLQEIGGPKILKHDLGTGALLMERLRPGTSLADVNLGETECQRIFGTNAGLIATLDPFSAMPLGSYFTVKHPLLQRLLDTTAATVFLHGDLHHLNILRDGSDWRPIDAKGLVGDPHFECVAYLRNPIDLLETVADLHSFTEARVMRLAKTYNLDPWRIAAWSFIDRLDSDAPPESAWARLRGVFQSLELSLRP